MTRQLPTRLTTAKARVQTDPLRDWICTHRATDVQYINRIVLAVRGAEKPQNKLKKTHMFDILSAYKVNGANMLASCRCLCPADEYKSSVISFILVSTETYLHVCKPKL